MRKSLKMKLIIKIINQINKTMKYQFNKKKMNKIKNYQKKRKIFILKMKQKIQKTIQIYIPKLIQS